MITEDKLEEEDLELLVANIMNECDEANKDYLDIEGIVLYIYTVYMYFENRFSQSDVGN